MPLMSVNILEKLFCLLLQERQYLRRRFKTNKNEIFVFDFYLFITFLLNYHHILELIWISVIRLSRCWIMSLWKCLLFSPRFCRNCFYLLIVLSICAMIMLVVTISWFFSAQELWFLANSSFFSFFILFYWFCDFFNLFSQPYHSINALSFHYY